MNKADEIEAATLQLINDTRTGLGRIPRSGLVPGEPDDPDYCPIKWSLDDCELGEEFAVFHDRIGGLTRARASLLRRLWRHTPVVAIDHTSWEFDPSSEVRLPVVFLEFISLFDDGRLSHLDATRLSGPNGAIELPAAERVGSEPELAIQWHNHDPAPVPELRPRSRGQVLYEFY